MITLDETSITSQMREAREVAQTKVNKWVQELNNLGLPLENIRVNYMSHFDEAPYMATSQGEIWTLDSYRLDGRDEPSLLHEMGHRVEDLISHTRGKELGRAEKEGFAEFYGIHMLPRVVTMDTQALPHLAARRKRNETEEFNHWDYASGEVIKSTYHSLLAKLDSFDHEALQRFVKGDFQ